MEKITKDVLKYLNNGHTNVEEKEDFKGNYYSFLTDTIYLSKNIAKQKIPRQVKNIDKRVGNLIVICHECIHSVQNKALHILNIILSNLSILLCVLCVALTAFGEKNQVVNICTEIVVLMAIVIRLILELEAINRSVIIAKKIIKKNNIDINESDIKKAKEFINKTKILALIRMTMDKLIAFVIVALIIII